MTGLFFLAVFLCVIFESAWPLALLAFMLAAQNAEDLQSLQSSCVEVAE